MLLAVALRTWADRQDEPQPFKLQGLLVVLAALMTLWHVCWVDRFHGSWQQELYLDVFNHTASAPHLFRALPYGFTRTLERITGDWWFSCLAYRWFFSYWFVWSWYRFARLFHDRCARC